MSQEDEFKNYSQSILGEDDPNDAEIIAWKDSVLNQVTGKSILPHYVEKDKDFSVIWGWITHFFAIIYKL